MGEMVGPAADAWKIPAYGIFQAKGWIRATAADLHHSHSTSESKPRLQPTPQLTATADP